MVGAFALSACSTTSVIEREYAEDGTTLKKETVSELSGNPFVIHAQNSKNKSWAYRQGGWYFGLGFGPANSSNIGISGGSVDIQLASFTDSEYGVAISEDIPAIYNESKYQLNVSSGGISSEDANPAPAKTAE